MSVKISQMTDVELRQMIGEIVEEKLLALLGDEEQDLPLRESLRKRLLEQTKKTENGERGKAFEDVVSIFKTIFPIHPKFPLTFSPPLS